MGLEIKFDGNWERDLNRMAQGHIDELAKKGTRAADRVLASHGGQSIEAIKPILNREMRRVGLTLPDAELTRYAQQISDGGRVVIQSERIK